MESLQFFLKNLYFFYDVPISLFKDEEYIFSPSENITNVNPFLQDKTLLISLRSKYNGEPFFEIENNSVFYGVCCNTEGLTIIIGPVSINNLTGIELHNYKQLHNLLNYNHFKIQVGSKSRTAAALSLLHERLNHEMIESNKIISSFDSHFTDFMIPENELFNYRFSNVIKDREHFSFHREENIMAAVTSGNFDILDTLQSGSNMDGVGIMATNSLKQVEYTIITGLVLFGRAAIKGGADPEEIYNIADIHKQKIAQCQNEEEMARVWNSAQRYIIECVNRSKTKKNGNLYVEQCKRFVAKKLHSHFTLEDMSEAIGISKCYLTHQFSLQEGKTLKNYIHEERIKAAQNMLKYSQEPISAIAEYLCFDSQSHFSTVFKKITHTTPAAFRNQNKTLGF